MGDAETLGSQQVFTGKVFSVSRDEVRMPNGRTVTVEVVRHSKSVVIVPVPEPGKVILIRQYRHADNAHLWGLPAGSVDQGEPPEQVKQFIETRRWALTVALDSSQSVGRDYGVDGIPFTVIIAPDGKVAWVHTGYSPEGEAEITKVVQQLLGGGSASVDPK